ncbi:ESX secretion-associated protein EspG [Actinophytocola sp. NPDC049390]|uniref:ESX secretion-associated protein EspG n=1 Tax=Actinophytocola sp. NPDC049390 TaxID=3363894 RepID=UPI0037AB8F35
MELRVNAGAPLHTVEVDLLCVFAEVEAPFPLEIPSTGTSEAEQRSLFRSAREQLTARGLADENGPLGVAEDFVFLLRSCTGVLDMVLAKEEVLLAAAVLVHRDEALLVTQDLASDDGMVRMKAATLDEALDDLVRLVPRADTPLTAPFSLPRRALETAFSALVDRDERLTAQEVDDVIAAQGIDDRVVRRMVSHLQPVLGNGQVGVARRDDTEDQWQRVGEELRWLDTERGRYRLAGDAEWMSVNPLSREEIRDTIRKLSLKTR